MATDVMRRLMKFPPVGDVDVLVKDALAMVDPPKHVDMDSTTAPQRPRIPPQHARGVRLLLRQMLPLV